MKKAKKKNYLRIIQGYEKSNNSSTKAQIFMKSETYIHKIVVYHQNFFEEDSPICRRARGVYVRSRDETCARSAPACFSL